MLAAGKVIRDQSKLIWRADQQVCVSEPFMAHGTLLSVRDGAWTVVPVGWRDVLLPWRGQDSAGWGQGGDALKS